MRLLAEDVEETRHVPAARDLVLGGDTEQAAQRGVAVQFGQAVLEGVMAKQDGQEHDVPQTLDGVVVAAVAAGGAEAVEEGLVRDGLEGVAEGGQGGAVVELPPGEE